MLDHHRRIDPWTNPVRPSKKKKLSKHAAISKGYYSSKQNHFKVFLSFLEVYTTLPNRIISKSFLVFWKYIPFFPFHGLLNDKYLDVFQPPGWKNYIKLKNHHWFLHHFPRCERQTLGKPGFQWSSMGRRITYTTDSLDRWQCGRRRTGNFTPVKRWKNIWSRS